MLQTARAAVCQAYCIGVFISLLNLSRGSVSWEFHSDPICFADKHGLPLMFVVNIYTAPFIQKDPKVHYKLIKDVSKNHISCHQNPATSIDWSPGFQEQISKHLF